MGLDLVSIGRSHRNSVRAGSYSYVHRLRYMAILSYVLATLRSKPSDDEDFNVRRREYVDTALSWTNLDSMEAEVSEEAVLLELKSSFTGMPIDYSAFSEYLDFMGSVMLGDPPGQALVGLYKFVNHSDCDGTHSVGDVLDIAMFFDYVKGTLGEADGELENVASFFLDAANDLAFVAYV